MGLRVAGGLGLRIEGLCITVDIVNTQCCNMRELAVSFSQSVISMWHICCCFCFDIFYF